MEWNDAVQTVLNWLLGLAAAGLMGIVGMNVQLWVLKSRFDCHERDCFKKHEDHEEADNRLWEEINRLKDRRK